MVTYVEDAYVVEIKPDFDPQGREYTHVSIGFRMPSPPIPPHLKNAYPPPPVVVGYKHIVHIIIPKERWNDQFRMWEKVRVIVKDGKLEVVKVVEK